MTKTSVKTKKEWLQKAQTLAEALPYMREFSGETFVIKYGGHAMGDRELSEKIAQPSLFEIFYKLQKLLE